MKELKQAISKGDYLMASLQLASVFRSNDCLADNYLGKVELWVEQAKAVMAQLIATLIILSDSSNFFMSNWLSVAMRRTIFPVNIVC